jgi:tRNA(Ile2) C34 agmatinyltransferase TiaS
MSYNVFIAGNSRGTCPSCSGVMEIIGNGQTFRCIDCRSAFRIIDGGYTDHELIVSRIKIKGKEATA